MSAYDEMFNYGAGQQRYPELYWRDQYERRYEADQLLSQMRLAGNKPVEMKIDTWLQTAQKITEGDRRKAYGHPLPNFIRAAIAFTPILGHPVTPLQIAELQVTWKIVRDVQTYKDDNWIDTIGYSNTVQMMDDRMKTLGYAKGVSYFSDFKGSGLLGIMYEILEINEKRFPKP